MVGKDNLKAEDLNSCFEKLMMLGGIGFQREGAKMEGIITEWKDIPTELLSQIVSLVDDQTVIVASGVCRGWRDAICLGLTHLSLSWYIFFHFFFSFFFSFLFSFLLQVFVLLQGQSCHIICHPSN